MERGSVTKNKRDDIRHFTESITYLCERDLPETMNSKSIVRGEERRWNIRPQN